MKPIPIVIISIILCGCSTPNNKQSCINYDDANFIDVTGVYAPRVFSEPQTRGTQFSYCPNTGNNIDEAVVITCFNAPTGKLAEGIVLRVLFGMQYPPDMEDYRVIEENEKVFHVYRIINTRKKHWRDKSRYREVYIDATQYHGLY